MKQLEYWIHQIELRFCQLFLLFIVILVFLAALLRWFGEPLVWSIDLATLLFVWTCFLGADLALQKEKHIGVDLFIRNLPETTQRVLKAVLLLLILIFLVLIAIYGTHLSIINYHRRFSGMNVSYSWATASVPVGCSLMIRTILLKMIRLIRIKKGIEG